MKQIWNFVQGEVLGMHWLNRGVGLLLEEAGIDTSGRIGGSLQFFIYDAIKILILLAALVFIITWVQSYFPPERTRRILTGLGAARASLVAALLGTVTPFCSCSSIPLFMGLARCGLPLQVIFSFLISSPMVDLGSLVLLTGIFGWKVALLYVLLGLAIAVIGGGIIGRMKMEDQLEMPSACGCGCCCKDAPRTLGRRIGLARRQAASTLVRMLPYVLAGVGVGALIHNWIPQSLVIRLLGNGNPFGVILAVLVGTPMYADIFGVIPIAEALLARGALLGVVLAFMMAVTTLSLPSLVMLRRALKPRLLGVFIGVCVLGIIAVGYIFNFIQPWLI